MKAHYINTKKKILIPHEGEKMDAKMKGKIMIGMVAASLLFALMAVMGSSWMSIDDDDDDIDFTLGGMEMSEGGISMDVDYSEVCDDTDDDDTCSAASAGTFGGLFIWLGIIVTIVAGLMMILPMFEIDAMDAIPEIGQKVVTWAAGGLILAGALLWWILMPEFEDGMGVGMSFFMAMFAGLLGLAAPLMDMFVPADE